MAKTMETTILVEIKWNASTSIKEVVRLVRTYSTDKRAAEDLALLQELNPDAVYELQTVEHIDD